jgi:hypothetical protein
VGDGLGVAGGGVARGAGVGSVARAGVVVARGVGFGVGVAFGDGERDVAVPDGRASGSGAWATETLGVGEGRLKPWRGPTGGGATRWLQSQ